MSRTHSEPLAPQRVLTDKNVPFQQSRRRTHIHSLLSLLVLLLGALGSNPLPAESGPSTQLTQVDVDAWLDGYLPYALQTGDIAGAVVVVVKDGEVVTERGFGYSDVARRTPVDLKLTLFRPGSVAKLFTWTAVMQMVEQGKVDLDTDINRYLDFKIPERYGRPVTLRNLLQHTPGFEDSAKNTILSDEQQSPPFEAWLKQWTPHRIFPPGQTPAYSNYGATLAGYIVQRVSGESFNDYLERHIFEPLEMSHSTFRQPLPAELAPLMSKGYLLASEEPKPFEFVASAPAGAMSSSGEDMAHFMIAHLQGGAYKERRILQPETARLMHDSPLTVLPPLNRMELGFFETNINGRQVIGHFGDTQYFHTALHLFLREGVGFYVSFNSLGRQGAAGSLRTALFEGFADRYFPGDPSRERVADNTASEHARMLAGNWTLSRRSQSNFLNAGELLSQLKIGVSPEGELLVPLPGLNGKPREWVERAPFVWHDTASHRTLAAKIVDGRAVRISIDLVAPFMLWERPPWYKNSAWLLPLLIASTAAMATTVLLWPVAALVRRHYGAAFARGPRPTRAYHLSRIAALAILAALLGWTVVFVKASSDFDFFSSASDALFRSLQVFGVIAFFGGCAAMLWNAWLVWTTGQRRWPARVWSVVLVLSALIVLWVAIAFKLTSFSLNY